MGNRYRPFGYTMRNGECHVEEREAQTVRRIFRAYIAGNSLQTIADRLSSGNIPYSIGTQAWNRNMVKRILENETYLGRAPYDPIIDRELFDQATSIRQNKSWSYSLPPECLKALRGKVHCMHCASPMKRSPARHSSVWICTGDGCVGGRLEDAQLIDRIVLLLNMLVVTPSAIQIPDIDPTIQSTRLIRLSNEITRQLDSIQCNEQEATTLILAAAAEKYAVCDDGARAVAGSQLQQMFGSMETLDGFDAEIFTTTVQAVLVDAKGQLQLILTNGQRFPAFGDEAVQQHENI